MKRINILSILGVLFFCVFLYACKKEATYETITPPVQAHFTNKTQARYIIQTPTTKYKIPVGVTQPSSAARTINVTVTSPTGAVEGTHYNITSKTLTLDPGEALDSIEVQGVYNQYLAGRVDTLIFTLSGEGISESDYNNQFKLVLRGPCFENEINTNLMDLLGFYTATYDGGTFGISGGPYTTEISQIVQTSTTTALIRVKNIMDAGLNATFTLNWTDLSNPRITFSGQIIGGSASDYGYNNEWQMRPAASTTSTFSFCEQRFNIIGNLGPAPLGYFGGTYIVNVQR